MYSIMLKGYRTDTNLNNFLNSCDVLDGEVLKETKLVITTEQVPTNEYIKKMITHLHKGEFNGQQFKYMKCIKIKKEV